MTSAAIFTSPWTNNLWTGLFDADLWVPQVEFPASLFANGELGGVYRCDDFSKLFTTSDGSTNVTALSDPVGRIERITGTVDALNATTTQRPLLSQLATGQYHLYHDRVDDKLTLASMPAGLYTIGAATFSGVQVYQTWHRTTGTFNLPFSDFMELVIINRELTDIETSKLYSFLSTKIPAIGSTDVFRIHVFGNVDGNIASITQSADSGASWVFGDGTVATGLGCPVKTVSGVMTLTLRATSPQYITKINVEGLHSFGQLVFHQPLPSLQEFDIRYGYNYTGSFINLPYSVNLIKYRFAVQKVISANFDLSQFPALQFFSQLVNQCSGPAPDPSSNPNLLYYSINDNQYTGTFPDFSQNSALEYCDIGYNFFTNAIIDLSANSSLTYFYGIQAGLTGFTGTVSPTLGYFNVTNNYISVAAVNAILAAFVAAGRTSADGECVLNMAGYGNPTPTGQGITDKATLISRGWTVTTN